MSKCHRLLGMCPWYRRRQLCILRRREVRGGVWSTSLLPVPPGAYSDVPSSRECKLCPIWTYQSAPGGSNCAACAMFAPRVGSRTCVPPCSPSTVRKPDGTCAFCATNSVPAPLPSNSSDSLACVACPPGTVAVSGSRICAACAGGSAPTSPTVANCALCPSGSFAAAAAPQCTPCGLYEFVATSGATACATCPNGTLPNVARSGCLPLAACAPGGIHTSPRNASACNYCAPNSERARPGGVACVPCNTV